MKKTLFTIGSYIWAFMLGAYAVSQFKFDTPIEGYRWGITSFLLVMFIVATFNTKEK
jgi:hypothetical protein